jgi:hypothetical protein
MALVENATKSPAETELSLANMLKGAGLKLASALETDDAEMTLAVGETGFVATTGEAFAMGFEAAAGAGFATGFGAGFGF